MKEWAEGDRDFYVTDGPQVFKLFKEEGRLGQKRKKKWPF